MSQYLMNDATFDLHPALKDRSIHQFIVNDSGPSDFSFVVSRAENIADVTIEPFAERLVNDNGKALPKFTLHDEACWSSTICQPLN